MVSSVGTDGGGTSSDTCRGRGKDEGRGIDRDMGNGMLGACSKI